jgi:hypothetical protein
LPDYHSATAIAAYHDLLRMRNDDSIAEVTDVPFWEIRGNRAYWYETHRIGTSVRKRNIGEDSQALADRISRQRDLDDASKLCAERFLPLDGTTGALYSALARTGTFRLGGTIVGTHAFRLYEGELGVRLSFDQMAQTGDLDIAPFERLSLALGDKV